MALIPAEKIKEVTDLANKNLLSVVSLKVIMKQKGNSYVGLCPFHNEKTPSFNVTPGKQVYKCFGCGKGGRSAISFVMDSERMTYIEAVRYLANHFNILL